MADIFSCPWIKPRAGALTIGGFVAFAALLVGGGCGRPTAEEAARRVEKAYATAPELEQTSTVVITMKLPNRQHTNKERTRLYYRRPRMLRLETGSGTPEARAVCDGKSLYTRAMTPQSWLREPAPKQWKDSELLGLYTPASQELLLAMLDGEKPLSAAKDLSMADGVERVNGAKCYVLSASSEQAVGSAAFPFKKEQRLWVGTRDFLIRKCEVKLVPAGAGASGPLGELMKQLQGSEVETAKPSLRLGARADLFSFQSSPGTHVAAYSPGNPLNAFMGRVGGTQALVGKKAPALSLGRWVRGPETSLAALKGKVVLLDFWATWCVPCVQTAPILEQMQREYAERGFVVIGIHVSWESPADVRKFMRDHRMTYRVAMDKEDADERPLTYMRYKGESLPTAVLVDREGVIRWVGHPADREALESQIKGVL